MKIRERRQDGRLKEMTLDRKKRHKDAEKLMDLIRRFPLEEGRFRCLGTAAGISPSICRAL